MAQRAGGPLAGVAPGGGRGGGGQILAKISGSPPTKPKTHPYQKPEFLILVRSNRTRREFTRI